MHTDVGTGVGTDVGAAVGGKVAPGGKTAGGGVGGGGGGGLGGGGGKVAPGGSCVGAAVGAMPVAHGVRGVGAWLKRHCTKLHFPARKCRQTTLSDHIVKLLKNLKNVQTARAGTVTQKTITKQKQRLRDVDARKTCVP